MALPSWAPVLGVGLADSVAKYQQALLDLPELKDKRDELEARKQLRPLDTEAKRLALQRTIKQTQPDAPKRAVKVQDMPHLGGAIIWYDDGSYELQKGDAKQQHPPIITGGYKREYNPTTQQWDFSPMTSNDPAKVNQAQAIKIMEQLVGKPYGSFEAQDFNRQDVQQIRDAAGLGRSGIMVGPQDIIRRGDVYGTQPAAPIPATPGAASPSMPSIPLPAPRARLNAQSGKSATPKPPEQMVQSYAEYYTSLGPQRALQEYLNVLEDYPTGLTTLAREQALFRAFPSLDTSTGPSSQPAPTTPGIVPTLKTPRMLEHEQQLRTEEERKAQAQKDSENKERRAATDAQERLRIARVNSERSAYQRVKPYFEELDSMDMSKRLAADLEKNITPGAVGWRGILGGWANSLSQSLPVPQSIKDAIYNPNIPIVTTASAFLTYLHAASMKRMAGGTRGVTEGDTKRAQELLESLKVQQDPKTMITTLKTIQSIIQGMRPFIRTDIEKGGFNPDTRKPLSGYYFPPTEPAAPLSDEESKALEDALR